VPLQADFPLEHIAEQRRRFFGQPDRQVGLAEADLRLDAIGLRLQGAPVKRDGRVEIAVLAGLVGLLHGGRIIVALARAADVGSTGRQEKRQARAQDRRQFHSDLRSPRRLFFNAKISKACGRPQPIPQDFD